MVKNFSFNDNDDIDKVLHPSSNLIYIQELF